MASLWAAAEEIAGCLPGAALEPEGGSPRRPPSAPCPARPSRLRSSAGPATEGELGAEGNSSASLRLPPLQNGAIPLPCSAVPEGACGTLCLPGGPWEGQARLPFGCPSFQMPVPSCKGDLPTPHWGQWQHTPHPAPGQSLLPFKGTGVPVSKRRGHQPRAMSTGFFSLHAAATGAEGVGRRVWGVPAETPGSLHYSPSCCLVVLGRRLSFGRLP